MIPNPTKTNRPKILVGMSGGVDSSVTAALLVEQGYDVTGGFIKNWSDTKDLWTGECQWRGERRDALRVAAKLGIPLLTFDFEKEYRSRVLDRMFSEYESGITPNPDVLCNQEIKFGLFFEAAIKLGFDGIATGHYAQIRDEDGVAHLLKAIDPEKDQSYFLHRVAQEALSKSLFPIGHLPKSEVRVLAEKFELPVAQKPDSQGICFVGKVDFHEFLRKKIPAVPGEIVTPEGEVIGTHDGLDAYTIGQRHGLNVSKEGKTWYVAGKEKEKNRLIVVPDREHPLLYRSELRLRNIHWIAGIPSNPEIEVAVRYHSELVPGKLLPLAKGEQEGVLELARPAWAPAPGQSAVLYQGEECLGGGFIADDLVE
ncbi:tRNA 2-thiouridine(34) synthase MnmA [Patescibacteria group bacterium]|jgi:tRNA-specific 2-thiouridylase|nr:tRNA 2-thiouridine(34) synthase MnmA [Patescibacteria group bacterium]